MAAEFEVVIGSQRFDPLEEADRRTDDTVAPNRSPGWIVQFRSSLNADDVAYLRRVYGLRLTSYVPQLAYIERFPVATAEELRTDPLVRAVLIYDPRLKVSPTVDEGVGAANDDARGPQFDAVLFHDADPTSVAEQMASQGAEIIALLDDRSVGGRATIRLQLSDPDRVRLLAQSDDVRWIEPVAEIVDDSAEETSTAGQGLSVFERVWDHGLHGEDQIIGVLDSGKPDLDHCFFADRSQPVPNPSHRKVIALRNASGSDARAHPTFVAGCAAGDDVNNPGKAVWRGGAWGARLVCGNQRDLKSTTLHAELTAAGNSGATIHTNSWHAKPQGAHKPAVYDRHSIDVDAFTWLNEDHVVLGSSGNTPEEQGPPGTAKNAICVSAARDLPDRCLHGDGAPGPTADGRQKPDLMIVGCGVESAIVDTNCLVGPKDPCASSYATPIAAAAAALVRQYFMEGWYPSGTRDSEHGLIPSGALVKAVLIDSTAGETVVDKPDNGRGWGAVRLERSLRFDMGMRCLRVWDVRNADGLTTGTDWTRTVAVTSGAERLQVTLVWTEPPGTDGARPVVNDLDLKVTSPTGLIYLGNVFGQGVSKTGGTPERLNNVEVVIIDRPRAGAWNIAVQGTAVNIGNPGQGFAVVVNGGIAAA